MISLGSDITLDKGERTIKRHLTYANFSDVKIHMILLSPIKKNNYKRKITRNNRIFIYPIVCNNHFLLLIKGNSYINICVASYLSLIISCFNTNSLLLEIIINFLLIKSVSLLIGHIKYK